MIFRHQTKTVFFVRGLVPTATVSHLQIMMGIFVRGQVPTAIMLMMVFFFVRGQVPTAIMLMMVFFFVRGLVPTAVMLMMVFFFVRGLVPTAIMLMMVFFAILPLIVLFLLGDLIPTPMMSIVVILWLRRLVATTTTLVVEIFVLVVAAMPTTIVATSKMLPVARMHDVETRCGKLLVMSLNAIPIVARLGLSNDRNDDKRPQPSRQTAQPHHGPSRIDRYIPDRPGQTRKAESRPANVQPVNLQLASNQRQDGKKSGSTKRREENIMKIVFRAWFAMQATRYYASKGRADTANFSKWSIPVDVVRKISTRRVN